MSLQKQTKKGVLKYRHPDIQEGYEFLAAIDKSENGQDVFRIKGKYIGMLCEMIEWSELGYSSYKEFLADRENNAMAVTEIVNEIFNEITGIFGKKS